MNFKKFIISSLAVFSLSSFAQDMIKDNNINNNNTLSSGIIKFQGRIVENSCYFENINNCNRVFFVKEEETIYNQKENISFKLIFIKYD